MFRQEANYAKIIPGIEEAEETLRAICDGAVDAFVMQDGDGHLRLASRPCGRPAFS